MALFLSAFRLAMTGRIRTFQKALSHPAQAQHKRLQCILGANRNCLFGREHDFQALNDFDAYRKAVPIRPYDQFIPYVDRMRHGEAGILLDEPVTMFAMTSGTSAAPKFCPIGRRFTQEHHRTHLLWMYYLAGDHPEVWNGDFLTLVSAAESGRTAGDLPYGASSGRQYLNQAIPIRRKHPIPYEVFLIDDYQTRYYAILLFSLGAQLSFVTSVNPSSLVLLAQLLREQADPLLADLEAGTFHLVETLPAPLGEAITRRLKPRPGRARQLRDRVNTDGVLLPQTAWPELKAMATWQGGSAPFYLGQLDALWGHQPRRCLGLRASEGTFSIPTRDNDPSGVLAINGPVLEFAEAHTAIQEDTNTLLAHQLEQGKRYRTIITTSGGFYRYDLGDIVEVTGFCNQTPEIAFLHKAGNVLSITGEKVTENQVVHVMGSLETRWPCIAGFTVTLELIQPPRYVLAVEWSGPGTLPTQELLEAFDTALGQTNDEYAEKRKSGRLHPPRLLRLAPGAYRAHRAAMVAEGKPDGQIKPPHFIQPAGPGPCPVPGCPFFDRVELLASPAPGA